MFLERTWVVGGRPDAHPCRYRPGTHGLLRQAVVALLAATRVRGDDARAALVVRWWSGSLHGRPLHDVRLLWLLRSVESMARRRLRGASEGMMELLCLSLSEDSRGWWGYPTLLHC